MRAGVFVHSCEFSLSFLSMVFVFKTLQNCEPLQFVYLSDMSLFQSGREFQLERILELCSPDSKFYLNIDFLFFQSFFFFKQCFLTPRSMFYRPKWLETQTFPQTEEVLQPSLFWAEEGLQPSWFPSWVSTRFSRFILAPVACLIYTKMFKGYLRYKTLIAEDMLPETQVNDFFIS